MNLDNRIIGVPARYLLRYLRVLCLLTATCACSAQVQLPTVNLGDTNFEDAFGGPGWLLQEFPETDFASELKDSHGKTIPGRNRVTAYSTTTHVAFVSRKRVLGGWLSGEVLQPLVDLDVQLANGTSSRVRGFADLEVGAGLQWAPRKIGEGVLVHRMVFDVGLPTGKYSDRRPVNIGNHFVVVNPYYAARFAIIDEMGFIAGGEQRGAAADMFRRIYWTRLLLQAILCSACCTTSRESIKFCMERIFRICAETWP